MSIREARRKLFTDNKGTIFSATWRKKDKSLRKIAGIYGVAKHSNGGANTLEDHKEYVTVWDTNKRKYVALNLDTLTYFKCGSTEVNFS